jgi:AmmeMemoRadiSam system protein A
MGQRQETSPVVQLAKAAVIEYLSTGKAIQPTGILLQDLPAMAGVFVSLKKEGKLRGCIGTWAPAMPSLIQEVIRNAISAATGDPRFPPVTLQEVDQITFSVDVLTSPEPVTSLDQLDPVRFGVLVKKGVRQGLLLPDIEGVEQVEEQLDIAIRKAGIDPDREDGVPLDIFRFEVKRYT